MARSNLPVTLKDLRESASNGVGGGSTSSGFPAASAASNKGSKSDSQKLYTANPSINPAIHHIPSLPREKEALEMLQRVTREYLPIIQRRGYNVKSISELCCCNDGLDFATGRNRKLRKMGDNVWGYNQTTFSGNRGKSHTIHLRLRHVQAHESRLHTYEDVAGTLAHELAHCEYGPHNETFFKLMDDILDEHASLLASGITSGAGTNPLPAFGGIGQTLGGSSAGPSACPSATNVSAARLQAMTGRKLGGDGSFSQWMTPREAAVAAAMARHRQQQLRLRGNRCCRPCRKTNENDSDDEVVIIETDPALANKKKEAARSTQDLENQSKEEVPRSKKRALSGNDGNTTTEGDGKPHAKARATGKYVATAPADVIDLTSSDTEEDIWHCTRCTFLNNAKETQCDMCQHPR